MGKIGAAARADTNAAVLETLAASQADLGVSAPVAGTAVALDLLSSGQRVVVKNFKLPVIFRRHDGRNAEIEAGPLRMRIPLSDVLAIAEAGKAVKSGAAGAGRSAGVTVHAQPSDEPVGDEINVIGCTVEEATNRVDKFIDDAALAGKASVRIIHGHGMGALRRGLATFLSAHPLVESIHHEAADRGGEAITIAELRA
jgi:DNA mismatch repair protein MutS2